MKHWNEIGHFMPENIAPDIVQRGSIAGATWYLLKNEADRNMRTIKRILSGIWFCIGAGVCMLIFGLWGGIR